MITLLAATVLPLAPIGPVPDPPPPSPGYTQLLPNYLVQGDGIRVACTPTGSYCWPTNDGLPSYLAPA